MLKSKVNNTSAAIVDNPNKITLPGGIIIQRIPRAVGERIYYSKAWYMRAQVNKRRTWFKLGTDLKKAKAKACEIAISLGSGGITAQLGFEQGKVKQPKTGVATLGELIDSIELSTGVFDMAKASTVHDYLSSVKLVVREVAESKLGQKLDPAEILALPCTYLTAALVRDFRVLRVQGIPEGPGLRSAKLTANGHLRGAQAVLAPSVMDHYLSNQDCAQWMKALRRKNLWTDGDAFWFGDYRFRCIGWSDAVPRSAAVQDCWIMHAPPSGARTSMVAGGISHGDEEARDVCLAGNGPRFALGGHIHKPLGA